MRILLLGKDGQLGWELRRALLSFPNLVAMGRPDLDLGKLESLREYTRQSAPQVIINAAAFTAVDQAEEEEDAVFQINSAAPRVLAEEAARLGSLLIHFSTDYVFDGTKGAPYIESDRPNPLNAYGRAKLEAEKAIREVGGHHLVLRTSWIFSLRKSNFVTRILEQARSQKVIRVVDDQTGSPTWCRSLAQAVSTLIVTARAKGAEWLQERGGLYHLAGSGSASRFDWAEAILEEESRRHNGIAQNLQRAKSDEFPSTAIRPNYSALNSDQFEEVFGFRLPEWRSALALALER